MLLPSSPLEQRLFSMIPPRRFSSGRKITAESTVNQSTPSEPAACVCRSSAALYIAVAVTGGVVYFRLVKGWKIADMLYVTRSGLKKSIAQVTEGAGLLGFKRMSAFHQTGASLPFTA